MTALAMPVHTDLSGPAYFLERVFPIPPDTPPFGVQRILAIRDEFAKALDVEKLPKEDMDDFLYSLEHPERFIHLYKD